MDDLSAGGVELGALEAPRAGSRVADFRELTKPRITTMVLVTAAAGYFLAAGGAPSPLGLLAALVGIGLLAAGGSALNHYLERETDARMQRTANRPLPAGRMRPRTALAFGSGLVAAGLAWSWFMVNPLTALLGAGTVTGYLFVYTPLKRMSSLATVVGAVPGALPPVMGWTAATGELAIGAWALFGLLFVWQLPHFLAIAWMCREDYARGGFPMLTVLDPAGHRTARQMILWCAALVPVSLLPAALGLAGEVYFLGALGLGLAFLACTFGFARSHSIAAARRLLLASVVYLPAVLTVLVLDRPGG